MKKRVVVILAVLVLLAGGIAAARVLTRGSLPMPKQAENVERTTSDKNGEEPTPENSVEEPAGTPVTMAEAPVFTTTTESGLTVTAPNAFLQTQELSDVESAVAKLSANGNTVCVALVDLETRRGLWLNADELMYPASSIKAAYCLYLYETNGGAAGMSATVEDALVNSSNDSYRNLYFAFGLSGFETWLSRVGGIDLNPLPRAAALPGRLGQRPRRRLGGVLALQDVRLRGCERACRLPLPHHKLPHRRGAARHLRRMVQARLVSP